MGLTVWRKTDAACKDMHIVYAFVVYLKDLAALFCKPRYWNMGLQHSERSYTLRPTTGCFLINKIFLLSTEVPTDAFIGAKFTLCTRRELPLCRSESSGSFFMSKMLVCFSKQKSGSLRRGHSACRPRGVYIWMTICLLSNVERTCEVLLWDCGILQLTSNTDHHHYTAVLSAC